MFGVIRCFFKLLAVNHLQSSIAFTGSFLLPFHSYIQIILIWKALKWRTMTYMYCEAIISLDCKTVGFFLKISKEIGKAWRKSLACAKRASLTRPKGVWGEREKTVSRSSTTWPCPSTLVSLSVFSLVPDLLFDCSHVLEYAKYGLFCSL